MAKKKKSLKGGGRVSQEGRLLAEPDLGDQGSGRTRSAQRHHPAIKVVKVLKVMSRGKRGNRGKGTRERRREMWLLP